jgi:hypothetical protein
MKRNKWDFIFRLNLVRIVLIVLVWFLFVFLHNLIYSLFEFEEYFFPTLAVIVVPLYFFISVIYTLKKWAEKGGVKEFIGN